MCPMYSYSYISVLCFAAALSAAISYLAYLSFREKLEDLERELRVDAWKRHVEIKYILQDIHKSSAPKKEPKKTMQKKKENP